VVELAQPLEVSAVLLVGDGREIAKAPPGPFDIVVRDHVARSGSLGTQTVGVHLATQDTGDESGRVTARLLDVFGDIVRQADRDAASHTFTIAGAYLAPTARRDRTIAPPQSCRSHGAASVNRAKHDRQ
jgi:hypothetical protein